MKKYKISICTDDGIYIMINCESNNILEAINYACNKGYLVDDIDQVIEI